MPDYIDSDEVKAALQLVGETFADDDVELAVSSASQAIEGYKRTWYYPAEQTRTYQTRASETFIEVADLVSVTELRVDTDDDGDFETTWVEGTDFFLDPPNADVDGRPFERVSLVRRTGQVFPTSQRGIEVEGVWGWATTPKPVAQAAKILAIRFVTRSRHAPLGIVAVVAEAVAAARLGKIDPDVAFLLDTVPNRAQSNGSGSLQLG